MPDPQTTGWDEEAMAREIAKFADAPISDQPSVRFVGEVFGSIYGQPNWRRVKREKMKAQKAWLWQQREAPRG